MKKISAILAVMLIFVAQSSAFAISTSSEACCVMIGNTGQVLYEYNAKKHLGMASTTKIMTAIAAIENGNLEKEVTVSENAANQEGSSIYLKAGDRVRLVDILYGLMLNSGNDAAVAIAEAVSGSSEKFSVLMNDTAKKIGCKNTHFENPSGLSSPNHYSTAYDMALITAYAMKNETFKKIVSTKEYHFSNSSATTYLRNHNKLLWRYNGCMGVKTGFTKATGRCLVSCAERDGVQLIVVTLNDRDDWRDHQALFDYGFSKMGNMYIVKKNDVILTKKISGKRINLLAGSDVLIPCAKGNLPRLSMTTHTVDKISKDVFVGTKVGYAEIFVGKNKLCEINLLSGFDISKKSKIGIYQEFRYLLSRFLMR